MATARGTSELAPLDREGRAARLGSALRTHWPYVLLTMALAVAGAVAYMVLAEERYEARAEIYVAPVPPAEFAALPALRASAFAHSVPAAVGLTESPRVIARVRSRLGISGSRSAIADSVDVEPRADVNMLRIVGVAGTPQAAARIANAFAAGLVVERTRRFQERLRRATQRTAARLDALGADAQDAEAASLANRLADYHALAGAPDPTIEVVRTAEPPSSPAWPRPAVIVVFAVTLGLLIGGVVAVALELLNPTLISADMLAVPSGPRLLARIPRPSREETRRLLLAPAMVDDLPEPVRQLSDSIALILRNGSGPKTFLVTSADAREGAAIVAATVAGLIADGGVPVALLDVDFERAPLRAIVKGNGAPAPSVGELLTSGHGRYLHHLHRFETGPRRLRLVLAAPSDHQLRPSPYGVEALASELKSRVGALVISTPPLPAKETAALLGLADVVIVVVALNRTRRDRLTELRRMLALRHVEPNGYVALED
jgi:polysaccharide biosynthesis transport protein